MTYDGGVPRKEIRPKARSGEMIWYLIEKQTGMTQRFLGRSRIMCRKLTVLVSCFLALGLASSANSMQIAEVELLASDHKATNPTPPDGAIGVDNLLMQWTAGDTAAFHNIYFGTNPTLGAAEYKGQQPLAWNTYFHLGPFIPGATYYWRIDEVEADGTTIHTGDVWSFRAAISTVYDPDPKDGAIYVPVDAHLSWTAGFGAITHDVYFGTDETEVTNGTGGTFKVNQATTTYDPGLLTKDTRYYWRIDEVNNLNPNSPWTGPVWSFETIPDIPIADPALTGWWKLDEGSGTTALDWSGHDLHGTLMNGPQWVSGYDGGALEFDGLDDYVDISYPTDPTAYTLAAWVQVAQTGPVSIVVRTSPWGPTTQWSHQLRVTSAAMFEHYTWDGTECRATGTTNIDADTWYFVAATATNNGLVRLYVNGREEGTAATLGTLWVGGDRFLIGSNSGHGMGWYEGLIDDVHIYDYALSYEEIQQVMRIDPLAAWKAHPSNGGIVDIESATPLSWSPGDSAAKHDVYFGTDGDAVADADTTTTGIYRGRLDPNTYTPPEGVEMNQTYYWRIDEFNTDATISTGRVWSFTVADYLIIDDFEPYDDFCNRISYTWTDGWGHSGDPNCGVPPYGGNETGSTVGYENPPYAERTIVHGGLQSMPFEYINDGSTGMPFYSETERTFDTPQDWTRHGVKALSLWFRGYPPSVGSFSYDPGTDIYTMTADGQDIWNTQQPPGSGNWVEHDEFHYAYKQLSGNGSIQAQLLSVDNTNAWAKAGVMIRGTLDANSVHAMVVMTPANGVSFQRRPTVGGASEHTTLGGFQAPRWVRITRSGNVFTAEHSADGFTWETIGTQNIPMPASLYIGLALTSHSDDPTVACEATFSDVTITGTVTGQWQSQNIGITGNERKHCDRLYVAVEDSTGTVMVAEHSDPNAVLADTWQEWNIDLAEFAPVNLTSVKKMYIGVGNRDDPMCRGGDVTLFANSASGGSGKLFFDDVRIRTVGSPTVVVEGTVRDILNAEAIPYAKVTMAGQTSQEADGTYRIKLIVGVHVDLKETYGVRVEHTDYVPDEPNVWCWSPVLERDFVLMPKDKSGRISSYDPVYCFESKNDSRYFYTLDKYKWAKEPNLSERNGLLSDPNWTYKGITFCAETDKIVINQEVVTTPVFRFSHTSTDAVPAYTTDSLGPDPDDPGWTCDGEEAFHVFPSDKGCRPSNPRTPVDAKPVYRCSCPFYTIDLNKKCKSQCTDWPVAWYAFEGDPYDCFPSTYSTYNDWVALGKPTCWCEPYQCDGDANGCTETVLKFRVYGEDLKLVVDNWGVERYGLDPNPCADIDHKSETALKFRVYGKDLAMVVKNWKAKDSDLPGDCPRP